MSDIQDQIANMIDSWFPGMTTREGRDIMAAGILQRFDVQPKPVVSDEELGQWVKTSAAVDPTPREAANRFRARLDDAGLTIVRIEEIE